MELVFESALIEWRGPAPFVFAPIPADESEAIKAFAKQLSYGWGVIPATVTIGETQFTTSLFPKDGRFLVPVKLAVQRSEKIEVGSTIRINVELNLRSF